MPDGLLKPEVGTGVYCVYQTREPASLFIVERLSAKARSTGPSLGPDADVSYLASPYWTAVARGPGARTRR